MSLDPFNTLSELPPATCLALAQEHTDPDLQSLDKSLASSIYGTAPQHRIGRIEKVVDVALVLSNTGAVEMTQAVVNIAGTRVKGVGGGGAVKQVSGEI